MVHGVKNRLLDFPRVSRAHNQNHLAFEGLEDRDLSAHPHGGGLLGTQLQRAGIENGPIRSKAGICAFGGNEQRAGEQRVPRFFGHHTHPAAVAFVSAGKSIKAVQIIAGAEIFSDDGFQL